jgi:hypothetical protein
MVTELQREYTWRDALAAFTRVTKGTDAAPPGELAIAESFLRCYIAELEARSSLESVNAKLDELLNWRRASDPGMCLLGFPSSTGKFVCRCVLSACHEGQHDNGHGETWPALVSKPCHARFQDVPCVKNEGHDGAHRCADPANPLVPVEWNEISLHRRAPDHPAAGRPAQDGEAACAKQPLGLHADPSKRPTCALPMWHDGLHMDRVAVSHAGKAGEVWE